MALFSIESDVVFFLVLTKEEEEKAGAEVFVAYICRQQLLPVLLRM